MTARELAFQVLLECETKGAWANTALKKQLEKGPPDAREAALATRLTFSVLQHQLLLDWYIGELTRGRLQTPVKLVLRLGLAQLLLFDRIPPGAAVNESVNLAKRHCPRAAGLVNGVLRSFLRQKDRLVPPQDPGLQTSHPRWLVELLTRERGGRDVRALLECNNRIPPTVVQVNRCRAEDGEAAESLERNGVRVTPHPWLEHCLLLEHSGDLEHLEAFRRGLFYVQDTAARLAVLAAGPQEKMQVLDVCAAPGGKSFAAAMAMGDTGRVVACDLYPHKVDLIRAGARRLGLQSVEPVVRDSRQPNQDWNGTFDLVLADVPCSGLGIIRKKPDIRYRDPAEMEQLPSLQLDLLNRAADWVRPGGVLLYSTCTLVRRENREVVQAFLGQHGEFAPEPFSLPGPIGRTEGDITLWPDQYDTDGFYIAKLRKKP